MYKSYARGRTHQIVIYLFLCTTFWLYIRNIICYIHRVHYRIPIRFGKNYRLSVSWGEFKRILSKLNTFFKKLFIHNKLSYFYKLSSEEDSDRPYQVLSPSSNSIPLLAKHYQQTNLPESVKKRNL